MAQESQMNGPELEQYDDALGLTWEHPEILLLFPDSHHEALTQGM